MLARTLLDKGFDVNSANGCGATLLHVASITKHEKLGALLIAMGADPNAKNYRNETPVFLSANWSSNEILKLALNVGGDANWVVDNDSPYNTPLLIAVVNNNIDGVRLLMAHKGDATYTNGRGISAISLAEQQGRPEIVDLLESLSLRDRQ